jgi:hypothetical protein
MGACRCPPVRTTSPSVVRLPHRRPADQKTKTISRMMMMMTSSVPTPIYMPPAYPRR